MPVHDHRLLVCPPGTAAEVAARIATEGAAAVAAAGGRLFGVFTPQIGLPLTRVVVLTAWDDEAAAGVAGDTVLLDMSADSELLAPTSRPAPGAVLSDTGGIYARRWFDVAADDWPRFQALSEDAWGNFEDVHGSRVVGLWRSLTASTPERVRAWLLTWYRDLATWDRSRFWNAARDPAGEAAYRRFRERRAITRDTEVAILGRIV